jgi:hypothetical protein
MHQQYRHMIQALAVDIPGSLIVRTQMFPIAVCLSACNLDI